MGHEVSAVVLAAGMSRRMGRPKMLLPWRGQTVIRQVVSTLADAGLAHVLVVTGCHADEVAEALRGTGVQTVWNAAWAAGEMLSSIQAGLAELSHSAETKAALICLGDQPQMQTATVAAVLAAGAAGGWTRSVVPSYQMRAGHPILLPRSLWPDVLISREHLRAVMAAHMGQVDYLVVATSTILADLDTPEDYAREQGI